MSNIIDSIQLSGTVYTISGGSGGNYSAGRGIDITNDTISLDLPISAGSGNYSTMENAAYQSAGYASHAEGNYTNAFGNNSHAEGRNTQAIGSCSHAEGGFTNANNQYEHASGQYNVSNSASATFGDSGNTLFSVGNGTADDSRHNAFEIMQNGDIYLTLDGQDVKLQDHLGGGGGGNATVELTQAEYDALVSAGTVSANTYYIITDASPQDMSYYWTSAQTQSAITQATSGKVNTSSVVSSVTSASTDSEIPTAKAVYDAIPQGGGGGKAVSGGTNISITTGETADTINCTLPITTGTGTNSIMHGYGLQASGMYSHAEGEDTRAVGNYSHAEGGGYNYANGIYSHVEGYMTRTEGGWSHAEGWGSTANTECSHAEGNYVITKNKFEHSQGQYNNSVSASTTFGNSGNTLFSVGNGTADNARHNAFEIRQNGDIYLNDGTNDVKLQDYLQIKVVKLTQQEYDALTTKDNNTLYVIT